MSQIFEDFPACFAIFCDDCVEEKIINLQCFGMVHKTACSLQRLQGTATIFTPHDLDWLKAFNLPSKEHESGTCTL